MYSLDVPPVDSRDEYGEHRFLATNPELLVPPAKNLAPNWLNIHMKYKLTQVQKSMRWNLIW